MAPYKIHKEKDKKKRRSADEGKILFPDGYKSSAVVARATLGSADHEFEEEVPTTAPAQSFGRKEIGERTAAAEVVKGAVGSKEKGPTSPAGVGSTLLAIMLLVFMAVVALAVPIFLLVRFHGHPMSQVWILSLSICSYVFVFVSFIWRSRPLYIDLFRLSYGPLLAFCSESRICSTTATFVLLFSMIWAAGNLGYSLAVHRLRKGTKPAIHAEPSPFCPTKDTVEELNNTLYIGAPLAVLLWTLVMAIFLSLVALTDELYILMLLSYFGWIHVAFWLIIVILLPVNGTPHEGPVEFLVPALFPWLFLSPVLLFISQILAVLCHLLLMLAMVAFLWYNLAIYMHFLATAIPSTTTQENEDALHSKILKGNIGEVKPDPRIGETPSEAVATPANEDILHSGIQENEIGQVKFFPRPGTTSSEAGATLGNEDTLHSEILAEKIGQVKSDPRLGKTSSEAAATLGNEDTHTLHGEILEETFGETPSEAAVTLVLSM